MREAMQLHLDEIATKVSAGAHAILILDQAGWHGAKEGQDRPALYRSCHCRRVHPSSIPKRTSGYCSCDRTGCRTVSSGNPRRHRRSLLLRWNTLINQPWKIMSIAHRDWASSVTQSEDWYKTPLPGRSMSAQHAARTKARSVTVTVTRRPNGRLPERVCRGAAHVTLTGSLP